MPSLFRSLSIRLLFGLIKAFYGISLVFLPFRSVAQPVLSWTTSDYNGFGVSCYGYSDGSIDLTITGGLAPYVILWSNGDTTEDLTSLAAGVYSVIVVDANNDSAFADIEITEPSELQAAVVAKTEVSCYGGNDGSLNISVSGGTQPYSYQWSNTATTEDIGALVAGSYTLTVTDGNGCQKGISESISQPDSIEIAMLINPAVGGYNGSIQSDVTGGVSPYGFLWSNNATTAVITGLAPGTYTVTVTDSNVCQQNREGAVPAVAACLVSIDQVDSVSCFGGTDGAIAISISGTFPPVSFLWSNGTTSQNLSGVPAGTYTVTVTDDIGCVTTASATISEPPAITNGFSVIHTSCGNSNGQITASASGGTGALAYLWNTGSTSPVISSLPAGTYTVTITDENGCSLVQSATVNPSSIPFIVIDSVFNVACFGESTGRIYITAFNGVLPYASFLWSNGASTEDLLNVASGTYTVTVTDNVGCTASATQNISQPGSALSVTLSPVNSTCGNPNGSITANASGGSPGYSYLWSNGQTGFNAVNLSAGTYTVTVTDNNGCTVTAQSTISTSPNPVITLDSIIPVKCFGQSNGSIYITVTSGTPSYGYLWSDNSTGPDLINVTASVYTVTVTDALGCTATLSATITQPTLLQDSTTTTPTLCGNSSGTATVWPYGGTTPYSVLWSTGATSLTITGQPAGAYTVTVTDSAGCTTSSIAVINNIGGPVITVDSVIPVSCFGLSDGAIYTTITGGALPYQTILWTNGTTTDDNINIPAGFYTLIVIDQNNCLSSVTRQVIQPSALQASAQTVSPTCQNANGSIKVSPSGGNPPYSYLWSNSATTDSISGLAAGTYTVTITDSKGCTLVKNYTLVTSGNPVITLDSLVAVKCFGQSTGAVYISVSGGISPYQYSWSPGGFTSQDITGVSAGVYTVTVTDFNSCESTAQFTVSQSPQLTGSVSTTSSTCGVANGTATAIINGGTPPYVSYFWSPGGQTTSAITGLLPGSYTVTVTDFFGCTFSASGNVSSTGGPVIQLDTLINVSCNGLSNGSISILVFGGTPGYSFLWLPGGQTTQNISGLSPGNYTVRVTDAVNCLSIQTYTITQPPALNDSLVIQAAACGNANGSVTAFPYGGTPGYAYLWSTGATTQGISGLLTGFYTVTITDTLGCVRTDQAFVPDVAGPVIASDSITSVSCNGSSDGGIQIFITGGTLPLTFLWSPNGQTTQNITGLPAGNYTVTVTDFNLCTTTASFTVNQPDVLSDSLVVSDASCGLNNGSITAFPYGGNSGYSYQWSNGQNTAAITGLAPATYTVTITDSKGCSVTDSATVGSIALPVLSVDSLIEPKCFGGNDGTICISVTGGVPPFTYQWSAGGNSACINGIAAGNYTVTVTDFSGCSLVQTIQLGQPGSVLIDSVSVIGASCNSSNGSISVFASGGTGILHYIWSTGPSDTLSFIQNQPAGLYTVTITDDNGCSLSQTFTLTDSGVPTLQSFSVTDVLCHGGNSGSVVVSAAGGSPPYSYLWSNGGTDSTITSLTAGVYTITLTDANGCSINQSFTVNEPAALQDSIIISNESCGNSNGALTVIPSGGIPPYTYVWSNGLTDSTITGLQAGVYTVTITDNNGCTLTVSATVINLAGATAVVDSVKQVSCYGGNDGVIYIGVAGGNGPLQFNWSNGQTSQNLINASAQTYTLTITDSLGCVTVVTQAVGQPDSLELTVTVTPAGCNLSNGSISVVATGGTPSYSFLWSNASTTSTITGLASGVYTVTVTDANGCSTDSTIQLLNPTSPAIIQTTVNNVLCHGDSSGSILPVVQGGSPPLSFIWSTQPPVSTLNLLNIPAGVYTITVTDANNCTTTSSYTVTEPDEINIVINVVPATCGISNGQVTTNVTGGTSSFSYVWSNGAGNVPSLSGIAAGVYTVTVTDGNGCSKEQTAFVSNIDGPQVTVTDSANASCAGSTDGYIKVSIAGGTQPYTISWTNTTQTDSIITGLAGNTTYTITVTDSNNCISFLSVYLSEPQPISANAVISQLNGSYNVSCNGAEDGFILLNPQGGNLPYVSFVWSNISFNQNLINVPAGNYTVTITDSKNCKGTFSFNLTDPPPVVAQTQGVTLICGIDADTLRAVLPTYGTGTWVSLAAGPVIANPAANISPVSNLALGNNFFSWIVTDGVCYDSAQYVITRNSEIIAISGADREICSSNTTLNATPPQFGYGYWQLISGSGIILDSTKAQTQVTGLSQGPNTFLWTVVNGSCIDDAPVTITLLPEEDCRETIQIPSGFTPNNDGFNDVFFIKGLEDYTEHTLVIYNRWGNKVFEQSPYLNRWKGVNMKNELLVEGTYYYIFTVKALDKTFNGFIDIRR